MASHQHPDAIIHAGPGQTISADPRVGLRFGNRGTHTSRTIMLAELSTLLRVASPCAVQEDYRRLIVDDNCLGKRTVASRRLTDQRLRELYALDPEVLLFRVMRTLWHADERGRPLLSLLLALARDPLLRLTAAPIMTMRPGEELGRQTLIDALNRGAGSRFNDAVLDKIVRNAASSWTQSGHLRGRNRKIRQVVSPTPAVMAYALVIGYAAGDRGITLFQNQWAKVLDMGADELIFLAMDAKRGGYLDIKASGGVVEVSITRLLTNEERRLIHGTN